MNILNKNVKTNPAVRGAAKNNSSFSNNRDKDEAVKAKVQAKFAQDITQDDWFWNTAVMS